MIYKKDYYKILNVEPTTPLHEIKSRFRKLAKQYHPDTGSNKDPEIFKDLAEAYDVLTDPVKRIEYDKEYLKKPEKKRGFLKQPFHPQPKTSNNARIRVDQPSVKPVDIAMDEKIIRQKVRDGQDPINAKLILALYLLDHNKNPIEAERLLNDVFKNNPYNPDTAFRLGVAKCHQGELEEAEKHFKLCMQLDPKHGGSFTCLTCLAWRKDNSTNVAYHLTRAPENAILSSRYWVLYGDFLHSHRNYQKAIEKFTEAINLAPDSVKAHMLLADCLWSVGRRNDAILHYQQAQMIEPENLSVKVSQALHTSMTGDIKLGNIVIPCLEDAEITDKMFRVNYKRNAVMELDLKKDDVLQADIEVIEGGNVNVIFMTVPEFNRYSKKAPYRYYTDATCLNTKHLIFSIKIPETQLHCIIVENSGFTPNGAEPDILYNSGTALVRFQVVVGIPGIISRPREGVFNMPAPMINVSTSSDRVVPLSSRARKRRVWFHVY